MINYCKDNDKISIRKEIGFWNSEDWILFVTEYHV